MKHALESKREMLLGGRSVPYLLRRSPVRRLRLAVSPKGIVLTLPHTMSELEGEWFLRTKARWLLRKIAFFESFKNLRSVRDPVFDQKRYLQLKRKALDFVTERLALYNRLYGFRYGRISIRNQKSRWGSCTRQGNLQFNYKLLLLPLPLADYIVVHELSHLKYLHHGERFWRLVARAYPRYLEARRTLRQHGYAYA